MEKETHAGHEAFGAEEKKVNASEQAEIPEESRERLKGFERKKSRDELAVADFVIASSRSFLHQYGYKAPSADREHVIILLEEGFQSLGIDDAGAAFDLGRDSIYIHESHTDSKIRFALRTAHEFFHRGTHPQDEDALDRIESLNAFNEAVMSELERRYFEEYIKKNELFTEELATTEEIKRDYPDAVQDEMQDLGYSNEDVTLIRKHLQPDDPESFTLELRRFSYIHEHRAFRELVEKCAQKGTDEDKEEVTRFFISAIPRGDFNVLKQRLDSMFGAGTFDQLRESVSDVESFETFVKQLT